MAGHIDASAAFSADIDHNGANTMLTIDTSERISIDGQTTGLAVTQRRDGTVVYTPGEFGRPYAEHKMPHARYSTTHDKPVSGAAGRIQFEADIRALLSSPASIPHELFRGRIL